MKLLPSLLGCLCLTVASSAFAQKEQWLTYHTSREGRAYRWLKLSTNPPPNVTLPKVGATAYYASWTTPFEPGKERWLCVDRTGKSGPCNRLFFDLNGNGRLDDDPPITTWRTEQNTAYFEPVRLVFKGEDGPITYHLVIRFSHYEGGRPDLLASSGGWYEGVVDFAGKKHRVELIDGNVNGTFNDLDADPYKSDRVQIEKDSAGERFLGKMLEVDGQFFDVEVAQDGAYVKVKKAENVVQGVVRVPETIGEFTAYGQNGHFIRKPEKGEFKLPAGSYRLMGWEMSRKDTSGASWTMSGYNFPDTNKFTVAGEQPARVEIGEPVQAEVTPRQTTNQVAFNLTFRGLQGETIQFMKGNQRPAGPKLMLASQDGVYRSTNTFEFG